MAIPIFMMVLCGAISLWGVINPRAFWKKTAAWSFKHPDANEPSDAGFAVQRAAYAFGLLVSVIMIPVFISASNSMEKANQEEAYEDCLDDHRGEESLLSPEDWCDNLAP